MRTTETIVAGLGALIFATVVSGFFGVGPMATPMDASLFSP
jgi:hypothetical protein